MGLFLLLGLGTLFILLDLLMPNLNLSQLYTIVSMSVSGFISVCFCIFGTIVTVQLKSVFNTIDSSAARIILIVVTIFVCVLFRAGTDLFFLIDDQSLDRGDFKIF